MSDENGHFYKEKSLERMLEAAAAWPAMKLRVQRLEESITDGSKWRQDAVAATAELGFKIRSVNDRMADIESQFEKEDANRWRWFGPVWKTLLGLAGGGLGAYLANLAGV